jgi:hypothetical protein
MAHPLEYLGETPRARMFDDTFNFARYIAGNTSKSATIFRRYDDVAVANILHLSNRIAYLEEQLRYPNADYFPLFESINETLESYCEYNDNARKAKTDVIIHTQIRLSSSTSTLSSLSVRPIAIFMMFSNGWRKISLGIA